MEETDENELVYPALELAEGESVSAQIVAIAEHIGRRGILREFFAPRYQASSVLTIVYVNNVPCLGFGFEEDWAQFCVEPSNGAVLWVDEDSTMFVNTSIDKFTETALALWDRFPFYPSYASRDDNSSVVAACKSLESLIESIDPPAIPGGFWGEFLDDVRMGDFGGDTE